MHLHEDDSGVALVTVVLVGLVIMLVTATLVAHALGSLYLSRRDQDWNAALAAAEAGIDDYINRANHNSSYWIYGPANPPPDGNRAFTGWVPVPGPSNEGSFRYTVDASRITAQGTVEIVSTGKVRGVTRTVRATLRPRTFLDYLYFTDYETLDPVLYPYYRGWTPAQAEARCGNRYDYDDGVNERHPECVEIQFTTGDVINGPLHTNDRMLINGATRFLGETSTSYTGDSRGKRWHGTGNPHFARRGDPRFAERLTMPPANTELKAASNPALGGRGCLFSGPTAIRLRADGRMDVWSPFSRPGNCRYGTTGYETVNLPGNGVVYVETAPSSRGTCANRPGNRGGGVRNRLGYPIDYDITQYGCYDGDVFLSGVLNGQLTIAAENRIVVVGDITYAGGPDGDDILGLIPQNNVEIYHPVRCSGSSCTELDIGSPDYFRDATVHAAILSLNHSFTVQNFQYGSHARLGSLRVFGAIAQKYRGPVGTGNGTNPVTGYLKDYVYDTRLRYISPPQFMNPVNSAWRVTTWAELSTPAAHRG